MSALKNILHPPYPKPNPYANPFNPNNTLSPRPTTSTPAPQPAAAAPPASPRGSFDYLAEARAVVGRDPVTGRRIAGFYDPPSTPGNNANDTSAPTFGRAQGRETGATTATTGQRQTVQDATQFFGSVHPEAPGENEHSVRKSKSRVRMWAEAMKERRRAKKEAFGDGIVDPGADGIGMGATGRGDGVINEVLAGKRPNEVSRVPIPVGGYYGPPPPRVTEYYAPGAREY